MKNRHAEMAIAAAVFALLAACERQPAPSPAQGPAPSLPSGATPPPVARSPVGDSAVPNPPAGKPSGPAAAGTVFVGPLSFVKPSDWVQQPPASKMRLAEFTTADGCAVVFFDDLGAIKPGEKPTDDMVKANLDRWTGQVLDTAGQPVAPTLAHHTPNALALSTFESTGVYQDGMPGGPRTPRPETTFRGVVVRTPDDLYFIRMTGPKAAMESHRAGWETVVNTMQAD